MIKYQKKNKINEEACYIIHRIFVKPLFSQTLYTNFTLLFDMQLT